MTEIDTSGFDAGTDSGGMDSGAMDTASDVDTSSDADTSIFVPEPDMSDMQPGESTGTEPNYDGDAWENCPPNQATEYTTTRPDGETEIDCVVPDPDADTIDVQWNEDGSSEMTVQPEAWRTPEVAEPGETE